jgi:hypothetical protein
MQLLKPIAVKIKDPAKLPETSRNALLPLVKSLQNPAGRLLIDKVYDVYGIAETQARNWAFLLVAETDELIWLDMQYCLYATPQYSATAQKHQSLEVLEISNTVVEDNDAESLDSDGEKLPEWAKGKPGRKKKIAE